MFWFLFLLLRLISLWVRVWVCPIWLFWVHKGALLWIVGWWNFHIWIWRFVLHNNSTILHFDSMTSCCFQQHWNWLLYLLVFTLISTAIPPLDSIILLITGTSWWSIYLKYWLLFWCDNSLLIFHNNIILCGLLCIHICLWGSQLCFTSSKSVRS